MPEKEHLELYVGKRASCGRADTMGEKQINGVTAKKGKSFIDRYSSKTSNSTREEV